MWMEANQTGILGGITPTTVVCILLCIIACGYEINKSNHNAKQGVVDKGAQHCITYGVFFTFVGIAVGLHNFEPANLSHSINDFLNGMRTAFFTSIIGMASAWIISRFIQDGIELSTENTMQQDFQQLKRLNQLAYLEGIPLITQEMAKMRETIETLTQITTSFSEANRKVIANSDTLRSQENQQIIESLSRLTQAVEKTSSQSIADVAGSLTKSIQSYITVSEESSREIHELSGQMGGQIAAIQQMNENLQQANKAQNESLQAMGDSIKVMADYAEKSYSNSERLLKETNEFQQKSLMNEQKQISVLSDNTDKIYEMKTAFNKFLEDMAEQNNKKFIEALNESMKDLNTKLTEQFGENFKQLNQAVGDLLVWQKQYKETIEETTDELKMINMIFSQFTTDVAPTVKAQAEQLNASLVSFSENTKQNLALQDELASTIGTVSSALQQNKIATEELGEFNKLLIQETHSAIDQHVQQFEQYTEQLAESMGEAQKQSSRLAMDTNNALQLFSRSSNDTLRGISETLESFDADFKNEIQEAMQKLGTNMSQIIKQNDEIIKQQVTELAGALGAITSRMTSNYTALVDKIVQVDMLLNKRK